MGRSLSRRQALAKAGVAALGGGAALVVAGPAAAAATPTVRGSWVIVPMRGGKPAGFQATAAFAAGGVFVTTGSDEAGTGIGQWVSKGANGFGFTYLNFHFDSVGKLSNTVKVRASGTFHGSTMVGKATLTMTDALGKPVGAPARSTFTGKRIPVESP